MFNPSLKQAGAAMLFFIVFFVVAASALTFLLGRSIFSDVQTLRLMTTAKQSYVAAESGIEDVAFRTMTGGYPIATTETMAVLGGVATTTTTYDALTDSFEIRSEAKVGTARRVSVLILELSAGTAFNYGLQSGNGGFTLTNSASIIGNAFSNGSVVGQGSSLIRGDVVSAGATGLIHRITATGTARAATVTNSTITNDLYCNTCTGSTQGGSRYAYSLVATATLPIPDEEVVEWQDRIEATGSEIPAGTGPCSDGTYDIESNATIGNIKIGCNLRIAKNSTVLTLTGPVWVEGNLIFEQGPEIRVSPLLGRFSVQMIADNQSNRTTSSKVDIGNSTEFFGSGHSSSFIMVLSMNNSGELGGAENAMTIGQSTAGALIAYAGHGIVNIANQIALKSVTGYRIDIGNNSSVTYDSGLANTLFTGGPGGGYEIADWYQE